MTPLNHHVTLISSHDLFILSRDLLILSGDLFFFVVITKSLVIIMTRRLIINHFMTILNSLPFTLIHYNLMTLYTIIITQPQVMVYLYAIFIIIITDLIISTNARNFLLSLSHFFVSPGIIMYVSNYELL